MKTPASNCIPILERSTSLRYRAGNEVNYLRQATARDLSRFLREFGRVSSSVWQDPGFGSVCKAVASPTPRARYSSKYMSSSRSYLLIAFLLNVIETNGITFRKGRDLSAWLGLMPRQHSTGGKTRLSGISKTGNEYLRRIFLHGARSVVAQFGRNPSALGQWLAVLSGRSHRNVTVSLWQTRWLEPHGQS